MLIVKPMRNKKRQTRKPRNAGKTSILRSLLCLALLMLPGCWAKSPPVYVETEPCRVPRLPGLVLNPAECMPGQVCMTELEALALAEWIFLVEEYRAAVRRCPLVTND